MNDDQIIKDILKDLEEMSVEDLLEDLKNCTGLGLGELQDKDLWKRVEEAENSENSVIVCEGDKRFEGFNNEDKA